MCIQERLLEASRAQEGIRQLPGHAHHMNFWALSVGARGPGRGKVGMAVCTSEAMGAVSLDARGRGWEGQSADVYTGEATGGLSSPRRGSAAPKACPPHEFLGSECRCEGARKGQGGHGCVYK